MLTALRVSGEAVARAYMRKYGATVAYVYETVDDTRPDRAMKKELARRGNSAMCVAVAPKTNGFVFFDFPVSGYVAAGVGTPDAMTSKLMGMVDLDAWEMAVAVKEAKSIRLMRGSNGLVWLVTAIRDYVIGRSKNGNRKPISRRKDEDSFYAIVKTTAPFERAVSDVLRERVRFPQNEPRRDGGSKAWLNLPVDGAALANKLFAEGKLERPSGGHRKIIKINVDFDPQGDTT